MSGRPSLVEQHRWGQGIACRSLLAVVSVAALLILALAPAPLALAGISILLLAAGFGLAAGCYLTTGERAAASTSGTYDVAGALVFLGFAAGIITDSGEALLALERLTVPTPAGTSN